MAGDVGGIDPAHPGLLAALAGVFGAAIGGFALWLANRLLGKAAFQTAINDGFAKLTAAQDRENDALRAEFAKARADWDQERLVWAGERASLKGEIRNLMQAQDSLKAFLRSRDIPIPDTRSAEPDAGAVILETSKPKDKL